MSAQPIDFARSRPPATTLAQVIMVTGVLACACAAWAYWAGRHHLLSAQSQLSDWRARQITVSEQLHQQKVESDQLLVKAVDGRLASAQIEMNYRWGSTLSSIEMSARPPAYLLALRMDPGQGKIDINAVAPDFNAALKLLGALSDHGLISEPRLQAREAPPTALGAESSDMRFSITAGWALHD
jgi:hypothetical protein